MILFRKKHHLKIHRNSLQFIFEDLVFFVLASSFLLFCKEHDYSEGNIRKTQNETRETGDDPNISKVINKIDVYPEESKDIFYNISHREKDGNVNILMPSRVNHEVFPSVRLVIDSFLLFEGALKPQSETSLWINMVENYKKIDIRANCGNRVLSKASRINRRKDQDLYLIVEIDCDSETPTIKTTQSDIRPVFI